uniref:Uncharacterized protein n=1 Tax=Glossina pallidipes TaxID=7398 RepID=A0A1B0A487_GLOPL
MMCNAPSGYEQVTKQVLKENEFDKIKLCQDCKSSKNYEMFLRVYSKESRSSAEMLSRAKNSDHGAKVVKKFQTFSRHILGNFKTMSVTSRSSPSQLVIVSTTTLIPLLVCIKVLLQLALILSVSFVSGRE